MGLSGRAQRQADVTQELMRNEEDDEQMTEEEGAIGGEESDAEKIAPSGTSVARQQASNVRRSLNTQLANTEEQQAVEERFERIENMMLNITGMLKQNNNNKRSPVKKTPSNASSSRSPASNTRSRGTGSRGKSNEYHPAAAESPMTRNMTNIAMTMQKLVDLNEVKKAEAGTLPGMKKALEDAGNDVKVSTSFLSRIDAELNADAKPFQKVMATNAASQMTIVTAIMTQCEEAGKILLDKEKSQDEVEQAFIRMVENTAVCLSRFSHLQVEEAGARRKSSLAKVPADVFVPASTCVRGPILATVQSIDQEFSIQKVLASQNQGKAANTQAGAAQQNKQFKNEKDVICFICAKPGHYATFCKERRQSGDSMRRRTRRSRSRSKSRSRSPSRRRSRSPHRDDRERRSSRKAR